jgi:hypothetical protein
VRSDDPRWVKRLCRYRDDAAWEDVWTPRGDHPDSTDPVWREPRDLCLSCPILAECRAWILAQRPDPCPESMVAALAPRQREEKRRNGLRAKCGTPTGRKEHAVLGEEPCDACREARNARDRELAQARRTA